MLKIDNSVFVLFVLSVLCAIYFSLFSIPLFSTGTKPPSKIVNVEERVKTLEVQVKTICEVLGMKVKAGDGKGNGGENAGEDGNKEDKSVEGVGMSGIPGVPNV
ncbi:hypothetical protein THOM_1013 [Trachipleistophora hominis]|uniref:Uncharacterized protein n=1 Tax=Trachipleistophora hominis TaxID=72359 RepID=L7JXG8_TRAHO|nr:hypothetical protein THOM_1013 [Trachipleistophora hominis]